MIMPYGQPPTGRLVVDSSYNRMTIALALTGPKVVINGQPAKVRWGQAPFDLPAGNYHLRVATRYLGEFGPAELPVTINPGQLTTVYYRPPATMGVKGALGFTPQKTPGMLGGLLLLQIAVIIVLVLAILTFVLN